MGPIAKWLALRTATSAPPVSAGFNFLNDGRFLVNNWFRHRIYYLLERLRQVNIITSQPAKDEQRKHSVRATRCIHELSVGVAVGVPPAVEPWRPARRNRRHLHSIAWIISSPVQAARRTPSTAGGTPTATPPTTREWTGMSRPQIIEWQNKPPYGFLICKTIG